MPYYRRAAKRPRYGKRLKYSVQQKAFSAGVVASPGTTLQPLVPATTLEGMRKVKHLMVNMAPVPDNAGPIYWAIVYVPQGTTPGVLNIDSTAVADMYEPNQFVMNCGIVDPTAGPIRFSSPVSRNLNNGDSIALLLRQTSTNTMGVDGTVRYAITPQLNLQ